MFTVGYVVYLFVVVTIFAILETQIEGKDGWAKNLPCWRPKPSSFAAKLYAAFMNGKELTGYHAAIFPLPLLILHFPFVAGTSWTFVRELETISIYFLMAVAWDFLWFLWNPAYGLKRFKPKFIPWHKKWWGKVPTDYPNGLIISVAFFLVARIIGGISVLVDWLTILTVFVCLVLVSSLISNLVIKHS